MDYKAFSQEFEKIINELLDFINMKNNLNIERIDGNKENLGIVNTYLNDISEGNYSLKVYKAKIIHNELEHTKTKNELVDVLAKANEEIDSLLNNYFNEYLETVGKETSSPKKSKDLKDFSAKHKKESQDITNKKNNLEKELVDKNKEFDQNIVEKGKEFLNKANDFKNKIQSELIKINDNVIKDYTPFENELIDVNDKARIQEINKQINDIRLEGIKKEYDLKLNSYEELYNLEKDHINVKYNLLLEKEKFNIDTKKKILDYSNHLIKINLDLEHNEKNYDAITEEKNINHCYEEIDMFVEMLGMINPYIDSFNNRDNDEVMLVDKLFVFDFIVLYLDYLLIFVRYNNVYDSLASILLDIIPIASGLKEKTYNLIKEQNAKHKEYEEALVNVLKDYDPHSRKVTKEEFLENVVTSLNRYYVNFYQEIDSFNMVMFNFLIKIANGIRENLNNLIPLENNDRLLPSNFMELSSRYKYVNINDYVGVEYKPLKQTDDEGNIINYTREELILDFANRLKSNYSERKDKISKITEELKNDYDEELKLKEYDYNQEVIKVDKDLKNVITKYDKLREKELSELIKSTNLNKVSAKKTNMESLKQLNAK